MYALALEQSSSPALLHLVVRCLTMYSLEVQSNTSAVLYNNAELHLQVYRKSATPGSAMTLQNAPITLDTGNYSLSELEEAIAKKLYELVNFAEHRNACDELHTAVTLNFANKHGPGSSGGVAVNTKVNVSDV
eukprot:COSAG06_NODE_25546_length_634_cov_0.856075_1_plen_132_part_10